MSHQSVPKVQQETETATQSSAVILQRKCACGQHTVAGGECAACRRKRRTNLSAAIQPKLTVGEPDDKYEREADRVAEQVMRMPEAGHQRHAGGEEKEPLQLQTKPLLQRRITGGESSGEAPPIVHEVLRSSGRPLDLATRAFMEPRFGHDFSHVRIHTDAKAAESAHALNARAYTVGRDVVLGTWPSAPEGTVRQRLLAHELSHVLQQDGAGALRERPRKLSQIEQPLIQRTLGDGHDLTSPRFSRLLDLEAAYDDETVIERGSSGRGVQAIQHALYDLGYPLPVYGADGDFGTETENAVKAFQRDQVPPISVDGEVGPITMAALDAEFSGAPALPAPAVLSAPWTAHCVRSILCPRSPHTIDVLSSRITLKSFDSISWADEEWDGSAWVPAPFSGGGYNTGTEIGVINTSCEDMSQTLYHEVLHAEQPTTHTTTRKKESYAYRIGEEFSIAAGLSGRPSLRSTDLQGRTFADPAKVRAFVSSEYPAVPASGAREEIIGKAGAHGHVRVRRSDGTIYTRPAAIGEKVPGPINLVNEVTHPTAGWTCP